MLIASLFSQWIQCSQPLAATLIDAPAIIILVTTALMGYHYRLADLTHVAGSICPMEYDWCAIARHHVTLQPSGFLASIPSNDIAASLMTATFTCCRILQNEKAKKNGSVYTRVKRTAL